MPDYQAWHLDPMDTWFFREAKPFDTLGAPELASQFPPPAATVSGALKTLIGRQQGIDWRQFRPRNNPDAAVNPDYARLAQLKLCGPFLSLDGQVLFPVPAFLLYQASLGYRRLVIGKTPVETDLGKVRLPELPADCRNQGFKPLDNAWITLDGLNALLAGDLPDSSAIKMAKELYSPESRLGIGRDNQTGCVKAEDRLLYQTCHIRPRDGVGLMAGIAGVDADLKPEAIRLGGEGRLSLMAATGQALELPARPQANAQTSGLILLLLTPADLDSCWRLPGCKAQCPDDRWNDENKTWRLTLQGVELNVQSAILGKPRREGGWHLAERKPRRVEGLVPAGSAWFCTVDNMPLQQAIEALHLAQIGDGQPMGRGLLAVGLWSEVLSPGPSPGYGRGESMPE